MDVVLAESGICYSGRSIVAFAVIEYVSRIPVVETEVFGQRAQVLIDIILDAAGDVVDPITDDVTAASR